MKHRRHVQNIALFLEAITGVEHLVEEDEKGPFVNPSTRKARLYLLDALQQKHTNSSPDQDSPCQ